MTVAVIGLVSTIIGFVIWLVKRKIEADEAKSPGVRLQEEVDRVQEELSRRDGDAAASRIDKWLRAIRSKSDHNPG